MTSIYTLSYAVPSSGYVWKWSESFDAIEWHDGSTLALWQEVHAVLANFEGRSGLPPFGSLLFIMAACRGDWRESLPVINQRIRKILAIEENDAIPQHIAKVLVTGLDTIHSLPADLRSSVAAKCHLVALLLEGGPHSISRDSSRHVLHDFSITGAKCIEGLSNERSDPKARLERDVRALELGLNRHSPETLESLLRTGLETIDFKSPEIQEKLAEVSDPRLLLDALITAGGESGAAAMVAKRTIAMINFPGHVGTPRDLPVGGIADITNRGTIDRLLPGELAWDDLVLAARLVHNEALYFRREIPPMNVAIAHTVLLSRELRLWGIGRVLSLGIALGLWHHPALNGLGETFECIAANGGDEFEYLELDSPAKISSALETLIPSDGPNPFLKSWWEAAQIVDDPAVPDISFITESSHLDNRDTCLLLGEIAAWIHSRGGYLRAISIDRDGHLEVQSWTPGGNRILFRGEMDVEEILASQGSRKGSGTESITTPQPLRVTDPRDALLKISLIYRETNLPFLFPISPIPESSIIDPISREARFGISSEGHLARWPKRDWGGQILSPEIRGRRHWIENFGENSLMITSSGHVPEDSVSVHSWSEGALQEIQIEASLHPFPRHAKIDGNVVILAYTNEVEVISLGGFRLHRQEIQALPPHPVLHWTGDSVTVISSKQEAEEGSPRISYGSPSIPWPTMLYPQSVSLKDGKLRIMCGNECFEFLPNESSWKKVKPDMDGFISFSQSRIKSSLGRELQVATKKGMRAWFDPIGMLHIGTESATDPTTHWTIMLASPGASFWSPKHGLCSNDPRLRHPDKSATDRTVISVLKSFLDHASSQQA